jgi:hypothetical protein
MPLTTAQAFWIKARMQLIYAIEIDPEQYVAESFHKRMLPPTKCPHCWRTKTLWALGYYGRNLSRLGLGALLIFVRRFRCHCCRKTVSLLPSFAQPYRFVQNRTIEKYVRGKHRNIRRESCGCDASGKDRKPSRSMATDIVLFPGVAATAHPMSCLASVAGPYKAVEQSYGENVLNLTLARGYVKKLLLNAKVVRFLSSKHSDIFSEFEAVAAMDTL